MKTLKTQKGITLVALVITIIVLLILAIVAIGAVRDSGIIGHAQNSAKQYNARKADEDSMLGNYETTISGYENGGGFKPEGDGPGEPIPGEDDKILWRLEEYDESCYVEFIESGEIEELIINSDEIKAFRCEEVKDPESGKYKWQLTDEIVTIKLSEQQKDVELNIGCVEEDVLIGTLKIGPNVFNLEHVSVYFAGIPNIIFLEGVKALPEYICSEDSKILTVSLPSTLETIGERAFDRCSGLTELNIPVKVTSIGDLAFYRATNLKKINYGGTMATWNSFVNLGLTSGAQVICSDGTITIE